MDSDTQDELFGSLRLIALAAEGEPMRPPARMVYSTSPECWLDADGVEYVVKGPQPEIVAAEAIAHLLASSLQIPLPEFLLAQKPDGSGPFFCSRLITNAMRDVVPWLQARPSDLLASVARIAAFDIWIANGDRNVSNLIGRPPPVGDASVEIVAIDFEKSHSLRDRHARITAPMVDPAGLWPTGLLGELLEGTPIPADFILQVGALTNEQINGIVSRAGSLIGPAYDWYDSTMAALTQRRKQLGDLVREVWR